MYELTAVDGGKGLTAVVAATAAASAAYSQWPTDKQEGCGGGGGGPRDLGAAAAMEGQQWSETFGRHERRKPHTDSARQDSPSGWG